MSDHPPAPQPQADDPAAESFAGLTRYERHSEIRQISYYLSGTILQSPYYKDLFYTLRTAAPTDSIYLHLNTCGGDFDTGLQIINNMMASSAHVVAVLEARADSMGAFIFLAADEMVVHDNCQLLFHNYSSVFSGIGNEQQPRQTAEADRRHGSGTSVHCTALSRPGALKKAPQKQGLINTA